ncbi:MAG: homoserine kinase [Gammaproteobacteria bacterium]|nr:homoserine kinase [Gammaproteobacteria bacterium]
MSIFTPVSEQELARHLEAYELGSLVKLEGISDGIENTNYFVTTTGAELVLTLFEATSEADLPFFLDLMAYLADRGMPCARPYPDRTGHFLRRLNGRPAVLVRRLPGKQAMRPSTAQRRVIGAALARLHQLTETASLRRGNDRGPAWWHPIATHVLPRLAAAERELLQAELAAQATLDESMLRRSVIHADLFRDNALFEGDELTGIIDFYYACTGAHAYDLAVTVDDWCSDATGTFDAGEARVLIAAYTALRPLTDAERAAWPLLLRRAALRFWLSRLHDLHFPRSGVMIKKKSPDRFRRILECLHGDDAALRALLG